MIQSSNAKLIHVGKIEAKDPRGLYLFLRQISSEQFVWYQEIAHGESQEIQTEISGLTINEALHKARRHWRHESFRTLNCGFRYSLPERDEHGCNALFHQMVASYSSSNGIYFDDDLGHNCIIHFASQEAWILWQKLKNANRLTTA